MAASGGTEPTDRGEPFDASLPPVAPTQEFLGAAAEFGITFDEGDLTRLGRFLAYLLDANTRFNLTAVSEPDAAWMRHVFDSLTLLPIIEACRADSDDTSGVNEDEPSREPVRIIDVGSGGGLPGVPLAICLPDAEVALLEATGKKARFLERVVESLELRNARVLRARAEETGRDREHHRERYDIVTCRAVGPLPALVELTVPLARVGGHVLAIKGERALGEIEQAKAALHALHVHALEPIRTPTGTVVVLRKLRATPKLYPRRPGEPGRSPIGT